MIVIEKIATDFVAQENKNNKEVRSINFVFIE